jgi:hypothetical protein
MNKFLGFEFLRAVVVKSSIFRDVTPCNRLKVNEHFAGTCLQIQDNLLLRPWRIYVPPKCRLTFNALHCTVSQKMELFMNKLNKDSRCAGRDSNQGVSNYEKKTVTSKPKYSLLYYLFHHRPRVR